MHKLLRLRPGTVPFCLCSSHRYGGGTLLDLLTALILLTPLAVIPFLVNATRWSWLMLLCVPVAYCLATLRHRFESAEWLARDLARIEHTPGPLRDTVDAIAEWPPTGT